MGQTATKPKDAAAESAPTFEEQLKRAVLDGLRDAVKTRMGNGYNSPIDTVLNAALADQGAGLKALLIECISGALGDQTVRDQIKAGVNAQLARLLIQKFGGELEKQVNTLKSDPATRARITLAIEDIIRAKGEPVTAA
jgi:hypothetical protein